MKRLNNCLQLDMGNSSAKWRLIVDGQVAARGRYVPGDDSSRAALMDSVDVAQIWVSSVASDERNAEMVELLEARWGVTPWFAVTAAQTGRLKNSYEEPSRMGVDRWLAMLGAMNHVEGRFAVVDAGSALTIDIVDETGQHEGGYIIPGPELMERALLLDTDRVRFEDVVEYSLSPGRSTAQAVRHGIALAQVGAVNLVMGNEAGPLLSLVWCGGGAELLAELSELEGKYEPDLVFEGLELLAKLQ